MRYNSERRLRDAVEKRIGRRLTTQEWQKHAPDWDPPYDDADLRDVVKSLPTKKAQTRSMMSARVNDCKIDLFIVGPPSKKELLDIYHALKAEAWNRVRAPRRRSPAKANISATVEPYGLYALMAPWGTVPDNPPGFRVTITVRAPVSDEELWRECRRYKNVVWDLERAPKEQHEFTDLERALLRFIDDQQLEYSDRLSPRIKPAESEFIILFRRWFAPPKRTWAQLMKSWNKEHDQWAYWSVLSFREELLAVYQKASAVVTTHMMYGGLHKRLPEA